MNRREKIDNIGKLEKQIEKQNIIILNERRKLRALEEELARENISNLPILLFSFNDSNTFYDVYYYADLDKYEKVIRDVGNYFLKKTIDMRKLFILNDENVENNYYQEEINDAVNYIKMIINDIFSKSKINSWNDLRNILINYNYNNTKVLKKEIR